MDHYAICMANSVYLDFLLNQLGICQMIGKVKVCWSFESLGFYEPTQDQRNKDVESFSTVEKDSSSPQEVRAGTIVNRELITQEVTQ